MTVTLSPIGTNWQRVRNLSEYLVGCPNALVPSIHREGNNPHLFSVGNRDYLAFANVEDRRRYVLGKLHRHAYRFFSLDFLCDMVMLRQDQVMHRLAGDMTDTQLRREVNNLIEFSCGWNVMLNASVERYGYQVLLGGLDQIGCPWSEELGPQMAFRIARGLHDYDRERASTDNRILETPTTKGQN